LATSDRPLTLNKKKLIKTEPTTVLAVSDSDLMMMKMISSAKEGSETLAILATLGEPM
jgi:hypothetical protein